MIIRIQTEKKFLKLWNIISILEDCFVEYSDKYSIEISHAHYRSPTHYGDHTDEKLELNTIIDDYALKNLDFDVLESQVGYRIVSRISNDRQYRDYTMDNKTKYSNKIMDSSMLFTKCCLRLKTMIDNDYDFKILSSPKNDRFYSYEYVLFIYPLKIDNHK